MSAQQTYHIRIRGNVLGPFRLEQVLKMIERGQLTQRHEVSCDGSEWRPAGDLPELFAPQSVPADAQAKSADPRVFPQAADAMSAQQASEAIWYYEREGSQNGPVPASLLTGLIAKGIVGAYNRVWRDGMADWQPVYATELAVHLPTHAASAPGFTAGPSPLLDAGQGTLSPKTIQLLLDIRLWSGILAACWSAFLGVLLILAFIGMLFAPTADARVSAVFLLLHCIVWSGPLAYLYAANNAMGALKYTPSSAVLDTVLTRWRTFYLCLALLYVISLAIIVIAFIAGMAAGVDASRW